MQVPIVVSGAKRCAYCNEPIRMTRQGALALRIGETFLCNEFCAQAIREGARPQEYAS
jgi:hypothetical protein